MYQSGLSQGNRAALSIWGMRFIMDIISYRNMEELGEMKVWNKKWGEDTVTSWSANITSKNGKVRA